eukprot:10860569-Ditylum_brightwellii.AAC.1
MLQSNNWDPTKLYAPNSDLVPKKKTLDDDIPFEEGRELIVDLPIHPKGMVDVYIDDTIGLTVDLKDNDRRMEKAI